MNIDNEILNDFHAMDDARQRQVRAMLRALALGFPRATPPKLSLVVPVVGSVVGDHLGEGTQNY
jgi:hypothetical protein